MTLQVTALPAHPNMPGKAGSQSQGKAGSQSQGKAGSQSQAPHCLGRIACIPRQPHRQHGQMPPAAGISHGDKKLGKSSHCQPLFPVLAAAKVMSLEKRAARKVEPARGSSSGRCHAWPGTASGLGGLHHAAGCPAPGYRCPMGAAQVFRVQES